MKLYLDDIRPCPEGWTYVNTVEQAIACVQDCLKRGETWEMVSLDHDLEDVHYASTGQSGSRHERTGMDFVDWMIEHGCWPTQFIIVHSQNPVGVKRMCQALDRYAPFDQKLINPPAYRMTR